MVRDFQSVIGVAARRQCLKKYWRLLDEAIACVGADILDVNSALETSFGGKSVRQFDELFMVLRNNGISRQESSTNL